MQKAQEQLYPEELRRGTEEMERESKRKKNGNTLGFREMDDFNFDAPIVFLFEGPE